MRKLIIVVIAVVIILGGGALIGASYYFGPVIKANQRGVVMSGKAAHDTQFIVLGPGKHYWFLSGYNPITRILKIVDVSEKELKLGGDKGITLVTKNGDSIKVSFSAWYRVVPDKVTVCVTSLADADIATMVCRVVSASAREQAALYVGDKFLDGQTQRKFAAKVKELANQQLASRGLELTMLKCGVFHFSASLLKKIEDIKKAQTEIEVNKVKVKAAAVAAKEMEKLAEGRKKAAILEAEARKKCAILASEAQIATAQNWLKAEEIKARIILIRSRIKTEAMQIEAQARKFFVGPEGERFLRYQIAESLAEAWTRQGGNGSEVNAISNSLRELSDTTGGTPAPLRAAAVKSAGKK